MRQWFVRPSISTSPSALLNTSPVIRDILGAPLDSSPFDPLWVSRRASLFTALWLVDNANGSGTSIDETVLLFRFLFCFALRCCRRCPEYPHDGGSVGAMRGGKAVS